MLVATKSLNPLILMVLGYCYFLCEFSPSVAKKISLAHTFVHGLFILFYMPIFPTDIISFKPMELLLVFPKEKMNYISAKFSGFCSKKCLCFSFLNIILLNSIINWWDIFALGSINIPFIFWFPYCLESWLSVLSLLPSNWHFLSC